MNALRARGRSISSRWSRLSASVKPNGRCSNLRRENVYLWLRRLRFIVAREVNDVKQASVHEIVAHIRFHNRLDTRSCIGRDCADPRCTVGPYAPKISDEAWFVLSK